MTKGTFSTTLLVFLLLWPTACTKAANLQDGPAQDQALKNKGDKDRGTDSRDLTSQVPFSASRLTPDIRQKLPNQEMTPVEVKRYIDGDTIELKGEGSVRLVGIDTPEKYEPLGKEATASLKNLLSQGQVYFNSGKSKKDRYGRRLGYLFVKKGDDKIFVNLHLVRTGMALCYFPSRKKHPLWTLFNGAEKKARAKKLHVWDREKYGNRFYQRSKMRRQKRLTKREIFTKKAYEMADQYEVTLKTRYMCVQKPKKPEAQTARLKEVQDGDTVTLTHYGKVRLLAIDTPERGEPFAKKAKAYLEMLLKDKEITVEYDKDKTDRYGRKLVHLFVKVEGKWLHVNGQMIWTGLAQHYFLGNNRRYKKLFIDEQRKARRGNRGKWAISGEIKKEDEYWGGGDKFHRPSCPNASRLRKRKIYKKRIDALEADLNPARCCNP